MKMKKIFAYTCAVFYSLMSVCEGAYLSKDLGHPPMLEEMTSFERRVFLQETYPDEEPEHRLSPEEILVREKLLEETHNTLLTLTDLGKIWNSEISQKKKQTKTEKQGWRVSKNPAGLLLGYKEFYETCQQMIYGSKLDKLYDHISYHSLNQNFSNQPLMNQWLTGALEAIRPWVNPARVAAWEVGCLARDTSTKRLKFSIRPLEELFSKILNQAHAAERALNELPKIIYYAPENKHLYDTALNPLNFIQKILPPSVGRLMEIQKKFEQERERLQAIPPATGEYIKVHASGRKIMFDSIPKKPGVPKDLLRLYRFYIEADSLNKTIIEPKITECHRIVEQVKRLIREEKPQVRQQQLKGKREKKAPKSKNSDPFFDRHHDGDAVSEASGSGVNRASGSADPAIEPSEHVVPTRVLHIPTYIELANERRIRQRQIQERQRQSLAEIVRDIPSDRLEIVQEGFRGNLLLQAFLYSPRKEFNYDRQFESLVTSLGGWIDRGTGSSHFKAYFTDNINGTYADLHGPGKKDYLTKQSRTNILQAMERAGIIRIN